MTSITANHLSRPIAAAAGQHPEFGIVHAHAAQRHIVDVLASGRALRIRAPRNVGHFKIADVDPAQFRPHDLNRDGVESYQKLATFTAAELRRSEPFRGPPQRPGSFVDLMRRFSAPQDVVVLPNGDGSFDVWGQRYVLPEPLPESKLDRVLGAIIAPIVGPILGHSLFGRRDEGVSPIAAFFSRRS